MLAVSGVSNVGVDRAGGDTARVGRCAVFTVDPGVPEGVSWETVSEGIGSADDPRKTLELAVRGVPGASVYILAMPRISSMSSVERDDVAASRPFLMMRGTGPRMAASSSALTVEAGVNIGTGMDEGRA